MTSKARTHVTAILTRLEDGSLDAAPVTSNLDAWFAETGLFVLALVAGVGLFGFWTALAGRPFMSALIGAESTGR